MADKAVVEIRVDVKRQVNERSAEYDRLQCKEHRDADQDDDGYAEFGA